MSDPKPFTKHRGCGPFTILPFPSATCVACGANLSQDGMAVAEVAVGFARVIEEPLLLIHASDASARQSLPTGLNESLRRFAQEQFEEVANHLRTTGVSIHTAFHTGEPILSLLKEVAEHRARLLVLGTPSGGATSPMTPIQVARQTSAATLIVRQPSSLLKWLSGGRNLRVLVGIDFSSGSWAALRWVRWLRQLRPCEVVVAVLESEVLPPAGVVENCKAEADALVRKSKRARERFFRRLVDTVLGWPRPGIRFEYGFSRSDAHFIGLARDERADLIAFGTSNHSAAEGNEHSVWPGVVRYGSFNIALVPQEFDSSPEALSPSVTQQTKL